MKKILATLLALTTLTPLSAQPQPVAMQAGRTQEGVLYFLPKTVLHFHLLVEHSTYQPGEYARYAEKYLRRTDIGLEPTTSCRLTDVTMTQTGVRDTSKCYAVRLKGGKNEAAEVHLSDDGLLLSVNTSPTQATPRSTFRSAPRAAKADITQLLPSEVLAAGSTAKKAELTAQFIYELRERRQQLVTGEADDLPQDEQQLRLMLSEIDHQHDLLMTLFTGTTLRDTTEHELTLCPDREVSRQVLFRMSNRLGLVDADDLTGVPYYISITVPDRVEAQKYPLPDAKKEGGFYVNQPAMTEITLQREDQQLTTFRLPLAQFGFVTVRGGQLFKRYPGAQLRLHPATGGVDLLRANNE